jgi:hypothetical protein
MGPRVDTPLGSAFWRPAMGWGAQRVTLWVIQRGRQRFKQPLDQQLNQRVVPRVIHRARGISG